VQAGPQAQPAEAAWPQRQSGPQPQFGPQLQLLFMGTSVAVIGGRSFTRCLTQRA